MRATITAAVGLFASFLPAQQTNLTAHPQETLQNSDGNLAAFGVFPSGFAGETRVHILVPQDELPGPGAVLVGIELHCTSASTLDYASLTIGALSTLATSLSNTFAVNLTAAPTVVLLAAPLQVAWSTSDWVPLMFTQPYVHDGASALLLEIQKVVQPAASYPFVRMTMSSSPPRTDRPAMVFSLGDPGSGASNALIATASSLPVSFRLRWNNTPTVRHLSDLGLSGNQYSLGGTVVQTLQGAPGSLWVLAAATGFLPMPITIPGIQGTLKLNGAVLFANGLLSAAGDATHTITLPSNPSLVGFRIAYQAATVDPATGAITLTNGTDHFFNP